MILGSAAVKLNIYSVENGINHLVDLTRSLTTTVQSGALSNQNFTEPNLMIVIGGTPHKFVSLEGFPPWHVRLTEIVVCD
ncbi:hypothetical protein BC937DRAFT_92844 [Endogone sp. FLAS-F59071]|nr:hypothetical protein BC937DRAFT_92844 [Endogone sp. FLAS-F59071]|eukprot:RUS15144.1 hypothetical protein BC937DRAFT_92844 [Endogone sp. FLAS-F59071]